MWEGGREGGRKRGRSLLTNVRQSKRYQGIFSEIKTVLWDVDAIYEQMDFLVPYLENLTNDDNFIKAPPPYV
jgi:hypothetical protein